MKYYRAVLYIKHDDENWPGEDIKGELKGDPGFLSDICDVILREFKETSEAKFLRAKDNEVK